MAVREIFPGHFTRLVVTLDLPFSLLLVLLWRLVPHLASLFLLPNFFPPLLCLITFSSLVCVCSVVSFLVRILTFSFHVFIWLFICFVPFMRLIPPPLIVIKVPFRTYYSVLVVCLCLINIITTICQLCLCFEYYIMSTSSSNIMSALLLHLLLFIGSTL